jgi:hypothetical protein
MGLVSAREGGRRALVGRHLWQLQDAAETLWYRLQNLKDQGGRYVMTEDYFAETTVYALGRVLAVERIFGLEGVYPELAEALIEHDGDHSRASTYVEFRRRYEDPALGERTWLEPAMQGVVQLEPNVIAQLMDRLVAIAARLQAWTQLPSSIAGKARASGASETAPAGRGR